MSIMTNHESGGRPGGHPPTAVQCALALVTAGLAVAAAMLALVETAKATYVRPLPDQEIQLQQALSALSHVQALWSPPPPPATASCPPALSATYSGTVQLDGQPAPGDVAVTASIDGQAWATATVSDGRYTMDIPQQWPDAPPCFPASGTILFTLDGYTCMPVEQEQGTGWLAFGYRSFAPGAHDADLLCVPAPTPTPTPPPDDDARAGALVIAELGEPLESAAAYREFWRTHPESSSAARAAFLSGLIPYQAGDAAAARAAWEEMLDAFPSPEHRAQAHLWLAKTNLALSSDDEAASAHLEEARAAAPGSFYALRAEAWLEDQATAPPARAEYSTTRATPDWDAVEEWLTSLWGPEAWAAEPSPFDLAAWQQGQELHEMGLEREATQNFLWVINQSSFQPWSLYRLARALDDLDMPHLAASAAVRLLAKASGSLGQAPRALLELAYPFAYSSLIQAAAAEYDLSPLLLLALIRQESFFDPLAVSPAGALGLTQVMPGTARGIATELGLEGFSESDLLYPKVSIQFGAHYLRSQLDAFAGNPYFALAAYNSGPDNVIRWSQSLPPSDVDLFVELIDFDETRSYVKLVLENYAVYRSLYSDADHPTFLAGPGS